MALTIFYSNLGLESREDHGFDFPLFLLEARHSHFFVAVLAVGLVDSCGVLLCYILTVQAFSLAGSSISGREVHSVFFLSSHSHGSWVGDKGL